MTEEETIREEYEAMIREAIRDFYVAELGMNWDDAEEDASEEVVGLGGIDKYDKDGKHHDLTVEFSVPSRTLAYSDNGFIVCERIVDDAEIYKKLNEYDFMGFLNECMEIVADREGIEWK